MLVTGSVNNLKEREQKICYHTYNKYSTGFRCVYIIRNVRCLLCIFAQLKISSNYFRRKDYLCRKVMILSLEDETV